MTSVNAGILVQLPMLKGLEKRRKRIIYEKSIEEKLGVIRVFIFNFRRPCLKLWT